uniref:DDE-1 domain-containing protein n=1 Tax=Phytophthora ramorum TaxID=164328 RepID=H3GYX3_PHYRM
MAGCHSACFAKEDMPVHKREMPKAKKSYTIAKKREALDLVAVSSELEAATRLGISRRTIRDWVAEKDKIREFTGSERSPTLKGQGKRELFPFFHGLINYMKDRRRAEKILSTKHMIIYIKSNHAGWLANYMADKVSPQSGIHALERACQRFCERYGYTPQKPQSTKKNAETLAVCVDYKLFEIFNVDETGIDFDMPPKRSWAGRGHHDSAKVLGLNKHSTRLTAVITARADGKKMPILFIVRGKPGGSIETKELKKYPKGHVYAVQENAWMDTRVWKKYTSELLKYEVNVPSLLLLDNFEAHISEVGQNAVLEDAIARVVPLPPNSTSVCQPLDVGVMGPLKQLMKSLWLIEDNTGDERAPDQCLICSKRTLAAWELLGEEDVKKAFVKAIHRYHTVEG